METSTAAELRQQSRDVIEHWKEWHRELSNVLGSKYLEVNVTLDAARELVERNRMLDAALREIEKLTELDDIHPTIRAIERKCREALTTGEGE